MILYIIAEAIASFLPKDTTPARAWTLAKVSLRSLKRDLRRKQGNFKVMIKQKYFFHNLKFSINTIHFQKAFR